jgi:hypothetical protein
MCDGGDDGMAAGHWRQRRVPCISAARTCERSRSNGVEPVETSAHRIAPLIHDFHLREASQGLREASQGSSGGVAESRTGGLVAGRVGASQGR